MRKYGDLTLYDICIVDTVPFQSQNHSRIHTLNLPVSHRHGLKSSFGTLRVKVVSISILIGNREGHLNPKSSSTKSKQ